MASEFSLDSDLDQEWFPPSGSLMGSPDWNQNDSLTSFSNNKNTLLSRHSSNGTVRETSYVDSEEPQWKKANMNVRGNILSQSNHLQKIFSASRERYSKNNFQV